MKKYIIKLYEYAELDEPARAKALDWYLNDGDTQYYDWENESELFIDTIRNKTGLTIDKNDFEVKNDRLYMVDNPNSSLNWLHYNDNLTIFENAFKNSCNDNTLINIVNNYDVVFSYDDNWGVFLDYINVDKKIPRLENKLRKEFAKALKGINEHLHDEIEYMNRIIYIIQYDYEEYTGVDNISVVCTDNGWYFDKEGNFINIIDLEEVNKDYDLEEEDQ